MALDPLDQPFAEVLQDEDLWSDDPDDPGHGTVWGLTKSADPDSGVWPIVDGYRTKPGFPEAMRHDQALLAAAKATYRKNYWLPMGCDSVKSAVIQAKLFNSAVNIGNGIVAQYLRIILNEFNRKQSLWPDVSLLPFVDTQVLDAVDKMLLEDEGERVLYDELNGWQRTYYDIGKDGFNALVAQIKAHPTGEWRETFEWGWEKNRTTDYAEALQRSQS